jgi:hypothetical protein
MRPNGEPVDSALPGCSQPPGDARKLPEASAEWRYRGDHMDLPFAVDLLIQQSRSALTR